MTRPPIEHIAMSTADLWSKRGTCPKKQVGAALMSVSGRILLTGYNGAPAGMPHCEDVGCDLDANGDCQRAIHAEANVIALAARHGIAIEGTWLYVTHFPCHKCAQLIVASGIVGVMYCTDRPHDIIKERTNTIFMAGRVRLRRINAYGT